MDEVTINTVRGCAKKYVEEIVQNEGLTEYDWGESDCEQGFVKGFLKCAEMFHIEIEGAK